jgi:hypothetical protein
MPKLLLALCFVASLLASCGDPDQGGPSPEPVTAETVATPLRARWAEEHQADLYEALSWRSIRVWVHATALRFAVAYSAATPTPVPDPVPLPSVAQTATPGSGSGPAGSVWDALGQCESGGDPTTNTGNGFYGLLQFTLQSWQAVGGTGYPHHASREEQISRGRALQAIQGWGAWPACSARLGLR